MEAKIVWLGIFLTLYAAFCIYRGKESADVATAHGYFIAGRGLGPFVFILAATAATFSGWTFLGHPAVIYVDGFAYAFTSLYAITIPLAGAFFLKRQWMLGKRFGYVTPGEMLSDYFGAGVMRLVVLALALCISVPFIALQLFASGFLLNALTDGMIPVAAGAVTMALLLGVYVLLGGLRGVAHVAAVQGLLLVFGIAVIGVVALTHVGGWTRLIDGIAALSGMDGGNRLLAVPGVIDLAASTEGRAWTSAMIFTYTLALMGIQCSPAFSMWALASKDPAPFAAQQVWASAFLVGLVLVVFSAVQGFAGHLLGADAAFAGRFPGLARDLLGPLLEAQYQAADLMQAPGRQLELVPLLIEMIVATAPWLVGLLAVCALSAMHSTAAAYMSTAGSMLARDLVHRHFAPAASQERQILFARIGSVLVLLAALAVAVAPRGTLVAFGGFAIAAGVQMLPALLALCYAPWITGPGVVAGIAAGLVAALLTDTAGAALGVTAWGRWPLTVHSAFWGLAVNGIVVLAVSAVSRNKERLERRRGFHAFLREHASLPEAKRRLVPLGWIAAAVWLIFAIGPGALVGNSLFGDPGEPASWLFGLPSIWAWQILWWGLGVLMLWFLAYRLELSTPPRRPVEPL